MRLDAGKGDHYWFVWHAEECRHVRKCRWVDDETQQYGIVIGHDQRGGLAIDVIQARKILILGSRRLVLINPVADDDDIETDLTETIDAAA